MAIASRDTPLYNSRIFDSYLKLIKRRYAHVDIGEILTHAGMKPFEVADPGHWFSQRQVNLFHEKLVELSGNPSISREAGRYGGSTNLGLMREFVIALAGPEYLFTILGRVAANYTRSSRIACRKVAPRHLEVTISFEEGVVESPHQCQNRIGFFEAIFLLFDYNAPEIDHTDCVFKGARVCRYQIRWEGTPDSRLILVRRLSFLLLLAIIVFAACLAPHGLAGALFLGTLALYLLIVTGVQRVERKSLQSSLGGMRASSEMLLGQIKGNYDTALMINEIGEVISGRTDLDDILASVNQVLCKRLDYGRGMILLADPDRSALLLRSCFGLSEKDERALEQLRHPLGPGAPQGVLLRCFTQQKSVLVNDLAEIAPLVTPGNYDFLAALRVKSFICAPIVCEGESLGILAVDDPKREGELRQGDLNLIQGVAPVIGIAIRNAMRLANERDLSDQLRKASEQLERRVRDRTAELSRANEVLEFLYDSVSHDLRAPIRIIYGYGELLLDGYGEQLDATARQYLDAMLSGGEQMEATLDRMLDFSQVRLMELTLQPVDLSRMAQRILGDLGATNPGRRLTTEIEEGVVVTGDEVILTSVMENLIGNAWKYSAAKPSSTIRFGVRDGAFFVSDDGAGFDMALVDRLFAPFQRLHDSKDFAGHGLGLSLVRCMIERQGGKVWGVGAPGEGATFYFTVPDPEGAPCDESAASPERGGRARLPYAMGEP